VNGTSNMLVINPNIVWKLLRKLLLTRELILLQIGGCGVALLMDDVSERNYPEDEDFWL
jgi:hypothetical protein